MTVLQAGRLGFNSLQVFSSSEQSSCGRPAQITDPLDGLDRGGAGCCKHPDARARRQVLQRCQGRTPRRPRIFNGLFSHNSRVRSRSEPSESRSGVTRSCSMWSNHSAGRCLGAFVFEYAVLPVQSGGRAGSMNLIACGCYLPLQLLHRPQHPPPHAFLLDMILV